MHVPRQGLPKRVMRSKSAADLGTVLEAFPLQDCGQYVVKGYAQQQGAGDAASTDVTLSIADGAVKDCSGQAFPGTTVTLPVPNRCRN
jgi:hypothetical protein